jgi:hypothetical protein
MYGILLSAANTFLAFVFRQIVVKFLVLFAIYFVIAAFVNTLASYVGGTSRCCAMSFDSSGLTAALSHLPAGIWFLLDLVSFTQGACLVVTAMVYRFLIRRIPLIG